MPVVTPRAQLLSDVDRAQHLLRRPSIRRFMLTPPPLAAELAMLSAARPRFTITTQEVQTGALEGTIGLHYLGVPSFSDAHGLSGGLLVTSYAARTHPLHAPAVMADVRVGRYVRDNRTGDWCIVTSSDRDNVTRLQYVSVRHHVARERICLTCDTALFDRGHILASVLFQCHDREFRTCPNCATSLCRCQLHTPQPPSIRGLADAAMTVMREGAAEWKGKVRVTVLSQNPRAGDIDECMDVTSSYQPSMDTVLAAQMQRLAIFEKANAATSIPAPITAPIIESPPSSRESSPVQHRATSTIETRDTSLSRSPSLSPSLSPPSLPRPESYHHQHDVDPLTTDDAPTSVNPGTSVDMADFTIPDTFDSVFMQTDSEVANHFLVLPDHSIPVLGEESAMLPADPSVLPGGVELCLDGMDLEEDWCSFVQNDPKTSSSSRVATDTSFDEANAAGSHSICNDATMPTTKAEPLETTIHESSFPMPNSVPETDFVPSNAKLHVDHIPHSMATPSQTFESPLASGPADISAVPSPSNRAIATPSMPLPVAVVQPICVAPADGTHPFIWQQHAVPHALLHSQDAIMMPGQLMPKLETENAVKRQGSSSTSTNATVTVKEEAFVTETGVEEKEGSDEKMTPGIQGRPLAPRPAGMSVTEGFIWQMGAFSGNQAVMNARLDAMEKERKAEERRKKNRQAAARSNARKKGVMDGIRAQIRESKVRATELRKRESLLREENRRLKERIGLAMEA